jgi:uncharacterized protein
LNSDAIVTLVERGMLTVAPLFDAEAGVIAAMMRRYADLPMSFTDACLVRLVELTQRSSLLTLDSDFRVYRQKGRRVIPVIAPAGR